MDINTIMREKQDADYMDWPDSADFRDFFWTKKSLKIIRVISIFRLKSVFLPFMSTPQQLVKKITAAARGMRRSG